ncbi:MAG: MoaD/ThiS family protein [Desulfitobacteriaceae bacterium]|nr:MoaD/ThiS family protein [Desulfitobacteriaceae bacterium]MDI6880793.1 MoaD/ThiS family protein [Desulfitobacteriaceae bacterium]MDI6915921.1 MoaD/ThiS family protein [Desulfitobacteriaceae bacterium]
MTEESNQAFTVEVRGLVFLRQIFKERGWPFPYHFDLDHECSAFDLAQKLDLPLDKIESVFINHSACALEEGWVKPGDRVTFVSPGVPGPHRYLLGIAKLG